MRGDDAELGIEAILGGVSFQDKAHIGYQSRPFDEEGSQVGKVLEGFVELDQVGFEITQVGVFALFGASFVRVGGRSDFLYVPEEGPRSLDGGALAKGWEVGMSEIGGGAGVVGGVGKVACC